MTNLRFVAPDLRRLDEAGTEAIICGVWQDERPFSGLAGLLDWRLKGRLSHLAKEGFLRGDVEEVLLVPVRPRLPFDTLLACGLGPRAAFDGATFRVVLARALDALKGLSTKGAVVELPHGLDAEVAADILLELIDDEGRDALCFVEDPENQVRIEKRAEERHRTILRTARI